MEYYDNSILKFEGEYLNGKRWNGKGYDINKNFNKKLIEVEFSNGEIWNAKRIEYNAQNELEFEGEYYKGKRWNGKGKEYKLDYNLK